ncbi:uncharacterized protein LOC131678283 [Topomyia yanbarensis]|uniref:uncharacterized protein LOC131678283 n=1 Tax=Topomyia yanbarensis TaxID=2498891 RepID=UPI00273A85B5|nr:uncharacterized protein LOC131678283 [Topomyia yanbarensis]
MESQTKRINRSNSDHAAQVSRSSGRREPEKLPSGKATKSVSNLSKPAAPKTCSKFTVTRTNSKPINKQLFSELNSPAKSETEVVTFRRKFPMEKSLTMIEIGSPSKQQKPPGSADDQLGGFSCSTTALAVGGRDRMVSNTSKLVYETGFKLLLKCWRDKKRQIDRLNAQLSHKDNTSIKYRNQLHTIQSLYQNECKNHETARSELRTQKQKMESLKANLLEEKTAHLSIVSELEASLIRQEKLQSKLTATEEELANAIVSWHGFESKLKQQEDRCGLLESEKKELLKQIDHLEENFKNFERDYERSLAEQATSNKIYEARLGGYQQKVDELNSQLNVYEADCQLLKDWNVRLASELAQIKGSYHSTYAFRMRRFFTNLPRKPGFYVQYLLYLLVQGTPLPKISSPSSRRMVSYANAVRY